MSIVSQNRESWPSVLPGFENISRIWDSPQNLCASRILPGEYYVTTKDEIITTVLGSCVSACIRDPLSGIGGMNHFMLPGNTARGMNQWAGEECLETRYGIAALAVIAQDLGETFPRKVNYSPMTGKVMVRRLRSLQNQTIADRDKNYASTLGEKKAPGSIELFD